MLPIPHCSHNLPRDGKCIKCHIEWHDNTILDCYAKIIKHLEMIERLNTKIKEGHQTLDESGGY